MSRAGYRTGEAIGTLMAYPFVTRPAKIIAKTGELIGYIGAALCIILLMLDHYMGLFGGEHSWVFILGAVAGFALMLATHYLARLIEKRLLKKTAPEQ